MRKPAPTTPRSARPAAAWAALLLAAAPLPGAPPLPGAREFPIARLAKDLGTSVPLRAVPDGIAFDVSGWAGLILPLPGAGPVQVDYRVTGNLLLSWFTAARDQSPNPHDAPWHHEVLQPGAGRITLDYRTTPLWNGDRLPYLFFEGTGTVVLTGLRAEMPSPSAQAQIDGLDAAMRWAPIREGHTTINYFNPHYWQYTSGLLVHEVLGGAFLVLAAAGTAAWYARRRRFRPAPAIAVAAVAVALAGNAFFLLRAWPVLALAPRADTPERLRANLHFDPELGALAALAMETVGPRERVGIQTRPVDWFAWELLCFHLQPRPCVRLLPGAERLEGLPGQEPLRPGEVDVVLHFHPDAPLPAGFAPAASVSPGALVARRR